MIIGMKKERKWVQYFLKNDFMLPHKMIENSVGESN